MPIEKAHCERYAIITTPGQISLRWLASFEVKLGPEILSLLLELSDKPVIKSRLEDLDLLKEPDPDPGPPLRWKDLIADNPGSYDKYLWYVKKRSIVPEYMPRLDGHWG